MKLLQSICKDKITRKGEEEAATVS